MRPLIIPVILFLLLPSCTKSGNPTTIYPDLSYVELRSGEDQGTQTGQQIMNAWNDTCYVTNDFKTQVRTYKLNSKEIFYAENKYQIIQQCHCYAPWVGYFAISKGYSANKKDTCTMLWEVCDTDIKPY